MEKYGYNLVMILFDGLFFSLLSEMEILIIISKGSGAVFMLLLNSVYMNH